jgi:hypothetical protein
MENKRVNIFNILLPTLLLVSLMTPALINYPVISNRAKETVIIVFVALVIYLMLWIFLKPDIFSRNGGLWIGFLFIVNISIEEFIDWKTKTSELVSTLSMMALIFVSFSVISCLKTINTGNLLKGLRSAFTSALLGTIIALCYGFLIDYIFRDRMVFVLKNYPGYNDYTDPVAFIFFNSFDNASNHVIVVPVVSLIMGAIGGMVALVILKMKNKNGHLNTND